MPGLPTMPCQRRSRGRGRDTLLAFAALLATAFGATGQEPISLLEGHEGWIQCLAISRDGKLLAAPSNSSVILWDPASGMKQRTIETSIRSIQAMAFSEDGKRLAVGRVVGE